MNRRVFLNHAAAAGAVWVFNADGAPQGTLSDEDQKILEQINAQRPSRLRQLPADFNRRVGASHVAGKYHFTSRPFLLEGGEKLLALGTRLGKFWFMPESAASSYPHNSTWPRCQTLTDLAKTDYFQQLFAMPFETFMLEAHTRQEGGWKKAQPADYYQQITQEFYELAAFLYQQFRPRNVTVILQHWEGDWMLRGTGKDWSTPPADWKQLCEQMARWLAARQAGVSRARKEFGAGAKCKIAHAAEVNRVKDGLKGIPNVTRNVLPQVELDLVSYSSYDALDSPLSLWKCIAEIRQHARTGSLFGPGAVCLGEVGIPENDAPDRITERWDEIMGVALASKMLYVAHWELYCNELNKKIQPPPKPPVKRLQELRGFWLVRPDGALSESGKYFSGLWQRKG